MRVDHVAFLVRSLETAVEFFQSLDLGDEPPLVIGEIEAFEGEGTRECYIGGEAGARLLLIEAVSAGPYQAALEKRGPGLHHVGVAFENAAALHQAIEGTGWLLHPNSLATLPSVAWVCRPGIPLLVEALLNNVRVSTQPLIERLELPVADEHVNRLGLLFGGFVKATSRPDPRLWLRGHAVTGFYK